MVNLESLQELTLKLEKLTEDRGKKKKMLENEVTSTLTTQASQILPSPFYQNRNFTDYM